MASGQFQLENFFRSLQNWGIMDVLLPFLLVFTVIYAILQKTHILGEKKNFNVVLAMVFGLVFVIPHVTHTYGTSYDPVDIINSALPQVSLVILAVLALLILVGIWGAESDWISGNTVTGGVVLLSALAVLIIFGSSAGWWQGWGWLQNILGSDTLAIVVMILVFGLIIWFVTGEDRQSKGDGMMKQLGDMFKKK